MCTEYPASSLPHNNFIDRIESGNLLKVQHACISSLSLSKPKVSHLHHRAEGEMLAVVGETWI